MAKAKEAKITEIKPTPSVADLSAMLMNKPVEITEAPIVEKQASTRATWSGILKFGLVSFAVKSYAGTSAETVAFNQLHSTCHTKLKQGDMYCPTCSCSVPRTDIVKGYNVGGDQFVTVTPEELKSLEAASEKSLEITEFVPVDQIDPIYFESTDYIAPDKNAEKPFALLRAGMIANKVVGIGKRVVKGREQTLVVRPYGKSGMTLSYLFFEHEIRDFRNWTEVALSDKEVEIASQLVGMLTEDFRPETKFDSYTVRVRQLLASKTPNSGVAAPVVVKLAEPTSTPDIMAALTASLEKVKAKKAAKK